MTKRSAKAGAGEAAPRSLHRPLTRRQRQMLRDAYEHRQGKGNPGWSSLYAPCPRIGDLRVLNGLAVRGFMTGGDHDDSPHTISVWPRWIRITPAGITAWEQIVASRVKP